MFFRGLGVLGGIGGLCIETWGFLSRSHNDRMIVAVPGKKTETKNEKKREKTRKNEKKRKKTKKNEKKSKKNEKKSKKTKKTKSLLIELKNEFYEMLEETKKPGSILFEGR